MTKRTHGTWRTVAATLVVVLVLAATPAVAQASTGPHTSPSWISWVVAQVGQLWQLVAGGNTAPDSSGQVGDPTP